jgi:hypothetical protein
MALSENQPDLAASSQEELAGLISDWNDRLENAGRESAGHAFNLGCGFGLLPALAIVVFSYFSTNGSWVAAVIIGAFMIIALAGFSNLVASIARSGAYRRLYKQEIQPEVIRCLRGRNIQSLDFHQAALANLSPEAPFLRLMNDLGPETIPQSEEST